VSVPSSSPICDDARVATGAGVVAPRGRAELGVAKEGLSVSSAWLGAEIRDCGRVRRRSTEMGARVAQAG
jgi:hypothetical protein